MACEALRQGGSARRMLARAHLWLGLTVGLIWALPGLTGAFLVLHREVKRAVLTSLQQGDPLSLDHQLATLRTRLPGCPLEASGAWMGTA